VSAVGRYRIINSGNNWTTWSIIDINNPQTPDITIVGSYEVQLSVTNSANVTSEWAPSTFTVSTTCGQTAPTTTSGTTTSGTTTSEPTPLNCTTYTLQNGAQSDATFSYIDCSGTFISSFMGGFENQSICAQTDSVNAESIISISPGGNC
jgi:hypothetical protein